MTSDDFERIAAEIRRARMSDEDRRALARRLVAEFDPVYLRFLRVKFMRQCGFTTGLV